MDTQKSDQSLNLYVSVSDPHLESWKSSLSQKITEKESDIKNLSEELFELEKQVEKQKRNLIAAQVSIRDTLVRVETQIDSFARNICETVKKTQEDLTQIEDSDELSSAPLQFKGHHLFQLFHQLHKKSVSFFSRKEFESKESNLRENNITDDNVVMMQKWLISILNNDQLDDTNWIDWLAPIWSLEDLFKQSLTEYKKIYNIYQKERTKMDEVNKQQLDEKTKLSVMHKEREALLSFSNTISECRLSGLPLDIIQNEDNEDKGISTESLKI